MFACVDCFGRWVGIGDGAWPPFAAEYLNLYLDISVLYHILSL